MKTRLLPAVLCACLCCIAPIVQAATYNLTPADDWYSVINGEGLQPGDEVILAGGTYVTADDKMLNIAHVGTAEQPIVIRAADGATPIITRNTFGAYNDYYVNLQHNTINMRGAQYVTLRGLEITGGNWAIRIGSKTTGVYVSDFLPMGNILRPAKNITVEYCKIHHVHNTAISANFPGDIYDGLVFRHNDISYTARYGEAFYLGNYGSSVMGIAKNCVIESNYLHDQVRANNWWYIDPAFSDYHGTGVQFKDGSHSNIIRNNVIQYTYYPAILVSGAAPSTFSAGDTIGPNIIEGNVIWQVSKVAGDITGQGIQCAADVTLRNNIIYAPQPLRIQTHQSSTPHAISVVNNTFVSTSTDTLQVANTPIGSILIANNALYRGPNRTDVIVGTGSSSGYVTKSGNVAILNLTAALVNPATLNFFPTTNSPLRNAATALYQSADDFNATARTGDLTVGAYVYNAAGNPGWDITTGFKPIYPAGDINHDTHVDALDLLGLAGSWGKSVGSPGCDAACDLNADSTVDVVDLLILAGNWGW